MIHSRIPWKEERVIENIKKIIINQELLLSIIRNKGTLIIAMIFKGINAKQIMLLNLINLPVLI